jgi:hypothetical protein
MLLDYVVKANERRDAVSLQRSIDHLFDCARRGDCPRSESCLDAVAEVRALLASSGR